MMLLNYLDPQARERTVSKFSLAELATITRFAEEFYRLYGGDDFRSTDNIRGIQSLDPQLNALAVQLLADTTCFEMFRNELAREINRLANQHGDVDTLVVEHPTKHVCKALGLPEDLVLMSVLPKNGPADVDVTIERAWNRWQHTRLFSITPNGIHLVKVDLETVFKSTFKVLTSTNSFNNNVSSVRTGRMGGPGAC